MGHVYQCQSFHVEPLLLNLKTMVGLPKDCAVPPFSIKVMPDYFGTGARYGLPKLIHDHATNLVALDICLEPENFKNILPSNDLKLPNVKRVTLEFCNPCGSIDDFVQPLLDACCKLEQLTFKTASAELPIFPPVPLDFHQLDLPSTLTGFTLQKWITSHHLRMLVRSPLPKLRILQLAFYNTSYDSNILARVLQNVSKSLEIFDVSGRKGSYWSAKTTKVYFT